MSEMIIESDGSVRFIYDDCLAEVARDIGVLSVRRASHVEPTDDGRWAADLSPVGGPVLGPFDTRREALSEEVLWLEANDVPVPMTVG